MTTNYQAEEVLAYDGESIKILWYPDATSQTRGLVKPDGTTITVSNGVLSANISGKQDTSNLTTSLNAQSTDAQYPSAKCVYDLIGNIETLLSQI